MHTLIAPGGAPASVRQRASSTTDAGASSGGLTTIVLPVASATDTFFVAISSGWFHGVIRPHTPSGRRRTIARWSFASANGGTVPSTLSASEA